jgi:glyoxylase-like metal-dependent hydrolase (beta-lactamase superfamily II)
VGAPRDAGRIMDAVRDAALTQIDHLILTHYHADHFGGMEELQKQIPIKEFIDHGAERAAGHRRGLGARHLSQTLRQGESTRSPSPATASR